MKKNILAVGLMLACTSIMADDYQYLTLTQKNKEQSIELASIQKITFEVEAGNLVVTTTEGEVRLPLSDMEKMYFSATPTAIAQLPVSSEKLTFQQGELRVKGEGILRIYAANGTLARMAKVKGETSIRLTNLPAGVYIVNLGNQTIKIRK